MLASSWMEIAAMLASEALATHAGFISVARRSLMISYAGGLPEKA